MKGFLLSIFALWCLNIYGAELKTVPLFHSCSVYWDGESKEAPVMEYRRTDAKVWLRAANMVNSPDYPVWRASLLQLEENTSYKLRLSLKDKVIAENTFTTWSPEIKIGSTIKLPQGAAKIDVKGSPDAWIRIVLPEEGLDGGDKEEAAILFDGAEYAFIENASIRGGRRHAIHIKNSSNIRIINCDVSGWGRPNNKRHVHRGMFVDDRKSIINYDAGVFIDLSSGVVVERNYMHDPRGGANSWLFDHPAGPCAVYVHAKDSTVIRYNDFIGSDRHRWNDVIEGVRNGFPDGGFARDADVYGNLMLLGNDDGIELDGGQMNVRVWGNQFEGSLTGISTAPCIRGPAYIWNNLIVRLGDEDGVGGQGFKNGYTFCGQGMIYAFHNTLLCKTALSPFGKGDGPRRYIATRNNVFDNAHGVFPMSQVAEKCDFDYDLYWSSYEDIRERTAERLNASGLEKHGLMAEPIYMNATAGDYRLAPQSPGYDISETIPGLENFSGAPGIKGDIPQRPTALKLSLKHIDFIEQDTDEVKMSISIAEGAEKRFRILQNTALDYFEVSPSQGVLRSGEPLELKVKLLRKDENKRFKGAFVVKLDDGFSRPVTVYSGQDAEFNIAADTPGVIALLNPENAQNNSYETTDFEGRRAMLLKGENRKLNEDKTAEFRFSVPEENWYYLAICFRPLTPYSSLSSIFYKVNDGEFGMSLMRYSSDWCWAGLTNRNIRQRGWFIPMKLAKGEHTLTVSAREDIAVSALAILCDPEVVSRNYGRSKR